VNEIGFELAQGPVPRQGAELVLAASGAPAEGRRVGMVTSGTYSPMLNRPLGMGYVEPAAASPGTSLTLTVRSQRYTGTVVKLLPSTPEFDRRSWVPPIPCTP